MFYFLLYLTLQVVLFGAWVSGTLDPYQKKFQEIILEAMGETKASYGLKKSLIGKKLIEGENFSKIQDALGNQIGGVFGKGGLGDGLGTMLSKGLVNYELLLADADENHGL